VQCAEDTPDNVPPVTSRDLVIVGAGEMGEIAYEYFTHDSPYDVVAFSVEVEHLETRELYGMPVVPFGPELVKRYPPSRHSAFVAITYTHFNRARERLYRAVKELGYDVVSYVSSKAFVWHNVAIGENCFIFEANVLQHHVRVGDNVILWSGNHIGHRSLIEDNCFISSHVVVSGYCEVGPYTFLGVNTSVRDYVKIAPNCIVGAGAVITKDTEEGNVYVGNPARATGKSSFDTFQIPEGELTQ
jgi:sugar O-acyltransferase (sialic acid O-acetyltransferase NeuD family)